MYDARWGEGLLMQLDFTTAGTAKRSEAFAAYENFTATLSSSDYFDLVEMLALTALNTVTTAIECLHTLHAII